MRHQLLIYPCLDPGALARVTPRPGHRHRVPVAHDMAWYWRQYLGDATDLAGDGDGIDERVDPRHAPRCLAGWLRRRSSSPGATRSTTRVSTTPLRVARRRRRGHDVRLPRPVPRVRRLRRVSTTRPRPHSTRSSPRWTAGAIGSSTSRPMTDGGAARPARHGVGAARPALVRPGDVRVRPQEVGRQLARLLLLVAGAEPDLRRAAPAWRGLGLVTSRPSPATTARSGCSGSPPPGDAALRDWLAESDPGVPVLKHGTAMRVWLGHLLEPERLRDLVEEHRQQMQRTRRAGRRGGRARRRSSGSPTRPW